MAEDFQPLCVKLGELGSLVEIDARLLTMLVRAPAPLHHRLTLLAKLATGEAGPTGPVADRARMEALKLARAPEAREALAASPATMELIRSLVQQQAA